MPLIFQEGNWENRSSYEIDSSWLKNNYRQQIINLKLNLAFGLIIWNKKYILLINSWILNFINKYF